MPKLRRDLGRRGGRGWGGEGTKCLFPAGQSGAQTFRLIVCCHCQHETKACDLSMCRTTALKTDAKPQGSGPATLFEGSAGWGGGWASLGAVRAGGRHPLPGGRGIYLPGTVQTKACPFTQTRPRPPKSPGHSELVLCRLGLKSGSSLSGVPGRAGPPGPRAPLSC